MSFHKLKIDKFKLIELCGTSESEFTSVSTTMKDLCFDVFGTAKEKKNPRAVKGNKAECSPKAFRFCSILLEQFIANFCIDKQSYWMNCLAKGNMKKPVMSLMTLPLTMKMGWRSFLGPLVTTTVRTSVGT
ncbi:hypothetical protein AAC387_Pa05g3043 [Persea americana]